MSAKGSMRCGHCGAELALPADLAALVAQCNYCKHSTPLPRELTHLRQEQLHAARYHADFAQAQAFDRKVHKVAGTMWVFLWIGIPVIVLGSVGFVVWRVMSAIPSIPSFPERPARAERDTPAATPPDPKVVEHVAPAVSALVAKGCKQVVRAAAPVRSSAATEATMREGGNCLHVVAAGSSGVRVSGVVVTPSGKRVRAEPSGSAALDFEHCPHEDGAHQIELNASDGADFAFALVDCPPERERYRDDPNRNGLATLQARMRELTTGGCGRVLLPAGIGFDAKSYTATLEPGPSCLVILAASGTPQNALVIELKTPFGDIVKAADTGPDVRFGYCPTQAGPHPISIKPATSDYYAVAGLECPRAVTEKLRAPARK